MKGEGGGMRGVFLAACFDGRPSQAFPALRVPLFKTVAAAVLASLWAGPALASTNDPSSGGWRAFGPLFSDVSLALGPGEGFEAAGPLWAEQESDGVHSWRLAPLVSREWDPVADRDEWDVLFPLSTYDRFGTEWQVQVLQMLRWSGGATVDGDVKRRRTLFPLYFEQRSASGTNDYLAVIPLYGRVRNRLFRDEVKFVLPPLYVESTKRGMVTRNVLFPVFHVRSGAGTRGWQAWPLVGAQSKAPTIRTNALDEAEVVPGHTLKFAAWPFLLSEKAGLGGPNPTTNLFAFPWHLRTRSPEMDHTWWMGFSHRTNRAARYEEWAYPWPFLGHARGPGRHSNRVFPFWGKATNATQQSDFVLWPVYTHRRLQSGTLDRERFRILFMGYASTREEDTATGRALRSRALWPLFTWRQQRDGKTRLQVLAPVEPAMPGNKSIERLYSPLWSVWRSESDPGRGKASQSLLWNLWRRERAGAETRASALFGLVQTRRDGGGRSWKVLGLTLGGGAKGAQAATGAEKASIAGGPRWAGVVQSRGR